MPARQGSRKGKVGADSRQQLDKHTTAAAWDQINQCLERLCGTTVVKQLTDKGHAQCLAQRACLEVFQSQQHVSLEAAEHWIDTHVPEALPADTKYQDIALTVSKIACIASSGKAEAGKGPKARKAWKTDSAASTAISPRLLLQSLPPSVWSNLEGSGELLQAMASIDTLPPPGASSRGKEGPGGSAEQEIAPGITCITLPLGPVPTAAPAAQASSSCSAPATDISATRGTDSSSSAPQASRSPASGAPASNESPAAAAPAPRSDRCTASGCVAELASYREWAEKRMGDMIRCLQESERARREELQRVQTAASQLSKEKELLEDRVKEYADGLLKLKEASYLDDKSREEGQRALESALCELRGAALREQELVTHVSEAVTQVKAERKRREGLESKVRAAHEARTEALAAAAKASDQLKAQTSELEHARKLAEERAALVKQAEDAAVEMRRQCDRQMADLQAPRAPPKTPDRGALSAAQAAAAAAEASATHAYAQVAQLQAQLVAAQQELAERLTRQDSSSASHCSVPSGTCYDHWTGSLFVAEPMRYQGLGPQTPPRTLSPAEPHGLTPAWVVRTPGRKEPEEQWQAGSPPPSHGGSWTIFDTLAASEHALPSFLVS